MTDDAINQAIAEECGAAGKWVLKKRGLYYRPNAHGYTDRLEEAWVVDDATALEHVYPHDEPVAKYPAPVPSYCTDLNAIMEEVRKLSLDDRDRYLACLESITQKSRMAAIMWTCVTAKAKQHCEAFLMLKGKRREA